MHLTLSFLPFPSRPVPSIPSLLFLFLSFPFLFPSVPSHFPSSFLSTPSFLLHSLTSELAEANIECDDFVVIGSQEEVDAVMAATPPSRAALDAAAEAALDASSARDGNTSRSASMSSLGRNSASAADNNSTMNSKTPPTTPRREGDMLASSPSTPLETPLKKYLSEARDRLLLPAARQTAGKDKDEEDQQAGGIVFDIAGHHFEIRRLPPKFEGDCEVCARPLRVLIKASRRMQCVHCKLNVHKRCKEGITRACVASRLALNGLETRVCPESGLCDQDYKCGECGVDVGFAGLFGKPPQLCDYSGRYFCADCHRGEVRVTPARVVRNWQFQLFPVSRTHRELLIAMHDRPCLDVEALNPSLFAHVEEMAELRRLRQKLRATLSFIIRCKLAQGEHLLSALARRRHFLTSSRWYSLKDLMDVRDAGLLATMQSTVAACVEHIKRHCETCKGKGSYCEICRSAAAKERAKDSSSITSVEAEDMSSPYPPKCDNIIYPFDDDTTQCSECRSTFHRRCFESAAACPKCVRLQKRRCAAEVR